jgi:DNA-binding NarL/FixJ family response regulator
MPVNTPTLVVVAHENAVIEAGIRHILEAWPEFQVQPHASSNQLAPTRAAEPDILVLDQESGIRCAMSHQLNPTVRTKVMVVASMAQETHVREALEAGVRGYVLVGCSADEIVTAARAVAAGRRHLCSAATLRMADSLAQPTLTVREGEVLALIFRGFNNKEVARALCISVGTVKSHMRGLLGKLGARCRTEALWIASQRGLITRPDGDVSDQGALPAHTTSAVRTAAPRTSGVRTRPLLNFGAQQSAAI